MNEADVLNYDNFILDVIESDDVRLVSDEIEKAHNYKKKVIFLHLVLSKSCTILFASF